MRFTGRDSGYTRAAKASKERSEVAVGYERIGRDTEFVILGSIGIWEVRMKTPELNCLFSFFENLGRDDEMYRFCLYFLLFDKAMKHQEAVNLIRHIEDPQEAAECLAKEALIRMTKKNISCLIIRF